MKDKSLEAYKRAKFGEEFVKDTARGEYEQRRAASEADAYASGDLVEAKIRAAMADGKFADLKGRGKPLPKDDYFDAPEHLRLAYHVLKNAGIQPEEVRLHKEIDALEARIAVAATDEERAELRKKLAEATTAYGLCMDYNRSLARKPI